MAPRRRPRCDHFEDAERDIIIEALSNYRDMLQSFLEDSDGDDIEDPRYQLKTVLDMIEEWKGK